MEEKGKILIVDDEEDILILFKEILEDEGYSVDIANNPKEGLKKAQEKLYDLIISDMKMPQMTGEEFLEELRKFNSVTSFIVITAYGTITNAVECIKKGAFHYITKPIDFNKPQIWKLIEEAVQKSKMLQENQKLKEDLTKLKDKISIDYIITQNDRMLSLLDYITKIAPYDFSVLITGESGTGKELFARAIHELSNRKDKIFLPINCANISPDIMEAEFFGYVKGAFTGADKDKRGIFENANGGTLFLDEIGEIPVSLQPKLLRFLENKEVRKVGGSETKKVDVRIIAATNRNLEKLIEEGRFREDLYYRLANFKIHIPPLRERKEDIPLLVYHFIEKFNKKLGKNIKGITPTALEILINYDWPGNVRQLKNTIEQAAVFASDEIDVIHLPQEIINTSEKKFSLEYKKAKEKYQQEFMIKYLKILLASSHGNISQAARIARIERQSLQKLLKKYNINPENFRKKD